ncbi:MAG: hypothetical protein ACJASR_000017 [Psychroserpens sp.]|jgi:hypothetical protein
MHKGRKAMVSSNNHPIQGSGHVGEFVVGGQEFGYVGKSYGGKKKKVVRAVALA